MKPLRCAELESDSAKGQLDSTPVYTAELSALGKPLSVGLYSAFMITKRAPAATSLPSLPLTTGALLSALLLGLLLP